VGFSLLSDFLPFCPFFTWLSPPSYSHYLQIFFSACSPSLPWSPSSSRTYRFLMNNYSLTPRRYNPCRVLADSRSRLKPSLSLALLFQFLTPSLSAALITPSIHLRFGLPTRLLPSGLSKVIFLHGRLSCIHNICPAHLSLVILTVVTKSVSSYR